MLNILIYQKTVLFNKGKICYENNAIEVYMKRRKILENMEREIDRKRQCVRWYVRNTYARNEQSLLFDLFKAFVNWWDSGTYTLVRSRVVTNQIFFSGKTFS